jgi:UDP-2,3-diacylglucosamine pyrophosphatase LpxH
MAELREICTEEGVAPLFVTGNHDPYADGPHYLDLLSKRVFVTHGDLLYQKISPWSRELEISRDALEKVFADFANADLADLDTRLDLMLRARLALKAVAPPVHGGPLGKLWTIFGEAWPPRRPIEILRVWLTAHRDAERVRSLYRPEASAMVYGHTHRPGLWIRNRALYINTGGFLTFSRALVVEIQRNSIQVFRVVRKSDWFCIGDAAAGEFRLAPPAARAHAAG